MRIVVCVKQVYDPKTVKISRSREEFDLREADRITNPADKYALEAALRLREAHGGEVIAVTVGSHEAADTAHEAVAMGADKAVLVTTHDGLTGRGVTSAIAVAVERLGDVDLVLAGAHTGLAGAVDGTGSLGPRLAAALGWPLVIDAVRIEENGAGLHATTADGARGELAAVPLPSVVVVIPGPDRPRYPHPSRIGIAWQPGLVETWALEDMGLAAELLAPDVEPGGLVLGPERTRAQVLNGSVVEAAAELVSILRGRRAI